MRLSDSPFFQLGVTPSTSRDDLRTAADAKVFTLGQEVCAEARRSLTMPKRRLAAELAWLPGVGDVAVENALGVLLSAPLEVLSLLQDWPPLARANMLVEVLLSSDLPSERQSDLLCKTLQAFDEIDTGALQSDLDFERLLAGLAEIQDPGDVPAALATRGRDLGQLLASAVLAAPDTILANMLAEAVEDAMARDVAISDVLDKLLQEYEAKEPIRAKLEIHANGMIEAADRLSAAAKLATRRSSLPAALTVLKWHVAALLEVVRPLALAHATRGLVHHQLERPVLRVHSALIDLSNDQGWYADALQVVALLQPLCELAPKLEELLVRDERALRRLVEQESDQKRTLAERARQTEQRRESQQRTQGEEATRNNSRSNSPSSGLSGCISPWFIVLAAIGGLSRLCDRKSDAPSSHAGANSMETVANTESQTAGNSRVSYSEGDSVAVALVHELDSLKVQMTRSGAELKAADAELAPSLGLLSAGFAADESAVLSIEASSTMLRESVKALRTSDRELDRLLSRHDGKARKLHRQNQALVAKYKIDFGAHNARVARRNTAFGELQARWAALQGPLEKRDAIATRYKEVIDLYYSAWEKLAARGKYQRGTDTVPLPHVELYTVRTPTQ